MTKIQEMLFEHQEQEYGDFIHHLTPTLPRSYFIGVRVPIIRLLAKSIDKTTMNTFFKSVPHQYYEENLLHGFLIQNIKDYDQCIQEVNRFLPYVDNWATCDTMQPKAFKKHHAEVMTQIHSWIKSTHTYTIRFGINTLMSLYLDADFKSEYLDIPASIKSEEYYVNIMIAWYYATALAKQWDATIIYLKRYKLPKWVHNKTIQKAIESSRISDERKAFLKDLKI